MAETTLASTQLARQNTIKALLDASKDAIARRLPKHLSADRIIKVALTAINTNIKLLSCTRESLTLSIMRAAELGLEPGGLLGEGYLVPYNCKVKGENGQERWEMQCQFIPGYRGLIVLARRSGEIANIFAEAVYKGDKFEVELGLNPKLSHVPDFDSESRDKDENITFTYAVARFKDESFQFVVLSRKQIEKLRARSKAATSGPWVTDYEEMAKKTAIRRLSKYLPLSVELAKALKYQEAAESGEFVTLDGVAELPVGDDGAEIDGLMDKLKIAAGDRKAMLESYKDNPAGLLNYLLKRAAPLAQPPTGQPQTLEAKTEPTQTTETKASTSPATEQASQAKTDAPQGQQSGEPPKRGRGRPKGSTKQQAQAPQAPPEHEEDGSEEEEPEPEPAVEDKPEPQQEVGKTGSFTF